jgi:hypothetical protein
MKLSKRAMLIRDLAEARWHLNESGAEQDILTFLDYWIREALRDASQESEGSSEATTQSMGDAVQPAAGSHGTNA